MAASILEAAERRDADADARDVGADARENTHDRENFLADGGVYGQDLPLRRSAALDRQHSKGDREASLDDREALTEDPS